MKVLLIDVNCMQSSTGKIVYDLFSQLIKKKHMATICYGRGVRVYEPNIYKFSSSIEVYLHAFLTRITGLTGCYSFFSTHKLLKFIEEYHPDVVHLHELHGYFVNILQLINYLKKKKIKTIWTFHCEFMYSGKCGYAYECGKWMTECGKCPYLRDYPSSFIFDFTKKMFNDKKRIFNGFDNLTIVAVSKWLADRVKQSFLSDKRIEVIHNGIDTENIFYPHKYDFLKKKHNITDEKIILAVAPDIMSERKGGRHVLELAKRMKNEKIKFLLVGVTEKNEKYDNNIIALQKTENQHELASYYSMADVFVMCSMRETFGMTCVEALSCGTPVCGFNAGGNIGIVPDAMGKLVEFGDINALEKSVRFFLNKGDLTRICCKYGQETFSKERMFDKYLALYESRISSEIST